MRVLYVILFTFLAFPAPAQRIANGDESKKMIEAVCLAAEKMATLKCDFEQTKQLSLLKTEMVSQGKMFYKGGKQLRWEYVSPYTYVFILNNDKVLLKSSGKTDVVSVKSSKLFRQISRIMMSSITGKCLSGAEDFKVTMYHADNGKWMACLIPRQKELAQLFNRVLLYIDPKLQMVTTVELIENGGDITKITLSNVEKNGKIADETFAVK